MPATVPKLTPSVLAQQLESLLGAFAERYGRARRCLDLHRDALRRADGEAVANAVAAQSAVLAEIEAVEKRRRELVVAACAAFPHIVTSRGQTVTLTQIAGVLPDPDRVRLTAAADQLRALAAEVKLASASIRAATNTLLAHMEGLMRHVGKQLSHSGTYGPKGVVGAGAAILSGLDLRS